jgi:hypothetical protein
MRATIAAVRTPRHYGDDEVSVDVETFAVIAGGLPPRASRLVHE